MGSENGVFCVAVFCSGCLRQREATPKPPGGNERQQEATPKPLAPAAKVKNPHAFPFRRQQEAAPKPRVAKAVTTGWENPSWHSYFRE